MCPLVFQRSTWPQTSTSSLDLANIARNRWLAQTIALTNRTAARLCSLVCVAYLPSLVYNSCPAITRRHNRSTPTLAICGVYSNW